MAARSIDGIDRALARYRVSALGVQITRYSVQVGAAPERDLERESRDRRQALGLPLLILKTPAWPREDWAMPQRRRVRPPTLR